MRISLFFGIVEVLRGNGHDVCNLRSDGAKNKCVCVENDNNKTNVANYESC